MRIHAIKVLASAVLFLVPYAAVAAEEWELTYSDTDTWGTDESNLDNQLPTYLANYDSEADIANIVSDAQRKVETSAVVDHVFVSAYSTVADDTLTVTLDTGGFAYGEWEWAGTPGYSTGIRIWFSINGKGTNDALAQATHSGGTGYARGWSRVTHLGVADSDEISGNESHSDILVQGVATVDDATPSATWTVNEGFGVTVDSDSGGTTEGNQYAEAGNDGDPGVVEYTISSNEPSWDIGYGSSFFSLYSEVSYQLKAVAELHSGTSGWAYGTSLGRSAGDGVTATIEWDEF